MSHSSAMAPPPRGNESSTPGVTVPSWAVALTALLALAGVLVALLPRLLARQPEPQCVTACGLRAFAARPLDCAGLNAHEERALRIFETWLPEWPQVKTCPALAGWGLQIVPNDGGGRYEDAYHRTISGQTFLELRVIQVADLSTDDWRQSAFAHELAHVFEFYLDGREPDYEHASWEARGIYPAINELGR